MHQLIAARTRAAFCNYLTQRASTDRAPYRSEISAASVSGQESCRVAIRSRAKVNTRTFPERLAATTGDKFRKIHLARLLTRASARARATRGRTLCEIASTRISRAVRVLYILLLRENTRRCRPARAQNRRAINPRAAAESRGFTLRATVSRRICMAVQQAHNYTRRFLPIPLSPSFFFLPMLSPRPIAGEISLGSERKASPIFGAGRCLMHMQARIHYARSGGQEVGGQAACTGE